MSERHVRKVMTFKEDNSRSAGKGCGDRGCKVKISLWVLLGVNKPRNFAQVLRPFKGLVSR